MGTELHQIDAGKVKSLWASFNTTVTDRQEKHDIGMDARLIY